MVFEKRLRQRVSVVGLAVAGGLAALLLIEAGESRAQSPQPVGDGAQITEVLEGPDRLALQTGTAEYQEPPEEINWQTHAMHEGEITYYNSRVTIPRLLGTPAWAPDQDNPPVSARKAMVAASECVRRVAPYGKEARLGAPTLKLRESNGRWLWVVYFSPADSRQFVSTFPIIVLMDGTVVEPKRIPPPPARFGDE